MGKGKNRREDTREAVEEALDAVEDGLDDVSHFLKRQMRDNPIGFTAAAFGVGMLIGLLMGRRG